MGSPLELKFEVDSLPPPRDDEVALVVDRGGGDVLELPAGTSSEEYSVSRLETSPDSSLPSLRVTVMELGLAESPYSHELRVRIGPRPPKWPKMDLASALK